VNTSETIHFIQSECFGDSSKLRLKPENAVHSENSVPTIESQGNFTRNSDKIMQFWRMVCDSNCKDQFLTAQTTTQYDFM
jgi:hypothetical protein